MDIFQVNKTPVVHEGFEHIVWTLVPFHPIGVETPGQFLLFRSFFMVRPAVHDNVFDVERFVAATRGHRRTSTHRKIEDVEVTTWRDPKKEVARLHPSRQTNRG